MQRLRVRISGVVQGVGFRPFIYRLACERCFTGSVWNDGGGVTLELQGNDAQGFLDAMQHGLPPVARIDSVTTETLPVVHDEIEFRILADDVSGGGTGRGALVTPDLMLCESCRSELYDPANRRYQYPFLNCTACGPRFTVVRSVPYAREHTTLDCFPLCPECAAEYGSPRDRRFHAEPIACHRCGPRIHLLRAPPANGAETVEAFLRAGRSAPGDDVEGLQRRVGVILEEGTRLLLDGGILAIKGMGGWHLACDATSESAVRRLRERKARDEKPFAVMFENLDVLNQHVRISEAERRALSGYQAPVVLLSMRAHPDAATPGHTLAPGPSSAPATATVSVAGIAPSVSPDGMFLGAALPSTPLHDLLLSHVKRPLVMTSGNRSGNPTVFDDDAAFDELDGIADAWLLHDREIVERCDDSVLRLDGERPVFYRRSRGYAPDILPVRGNFSGTVFAAGAFLNNAFAFGEGRRVLPGHHIGDLDHPSTVRAFRDGLRHYERLFHLETSLLVSDLHPDYSSTRMAAEEAERRGVPHVQVQHHEAHVASCLFDNGFFGPALGLALDGTGLGRDGTIWGGELFVVPGGGTPNAAMWRRAGGLLPIPMPGGDAAVREPWRMALSLLSLSLNASDLVREVRRLAVFAGVPGPPMEAAARRLRGEPVTSGCGRLFDAVSFLAGGPVKAGYEGHPAVYLESLLDRLSGEDLGHCEEPYEWSVLQSENRWLLDPTPMAGRMLADMQGGNTAPARMAHRFHEGLVRALVHLVDVVSRETGIRTVALSGGCLFNCYLSRGLDSGLTARGMRVLHHRNVPPGDGGIALGQLYLSGAFRADGADDPEG